VNALGCNFRNSAGILGDAIPAWQNEIITGSAPAPYVYRQAVPQLRSLVQQILKPGHAALLVDLIFGLIAIYASGLLHQGRDSDPRKFVWGSILGLLSIICSIPNDKPETVAMICLTVLFSHFAMSKQRTKALLVSLLFLAVRPEMSVFAGLSSLLTYESSATQIHKRLSWLVITFGILYILLAKFVLWPHSKYPAGTPTITLVLNFTSMTALAFLPLALGLLVLNASQIPMHTERRAQMSGNVTIALFNSSWISAVLFLGKIDEIRLMTPVLSSSALLFLAIMERKSSKQLVQVDA